MRFDVDRGSGKVIVRSPNDVLGILHNDAHLAPSGARAIANGLEIDGHRDLAAQLRAAADEAEAATR
ncbi:hypothetical protein H7J07_04785 [Mycobacterium koreense]|uniref:Uncharacterized protein n=1 Tax=Mycolicibacillus koreensis TaxID=1069220 RepID=A0A7I7SAN0_9MYCO|nr:hypothetical protein [Mycolicibacillus koreensis]MCV7247573.1 hypothetical protein [Mycolicibacillus koreensis]OSC32846.1 hypothetical protein B8W67_14100 [Mycolicibacillus koreensis]BBY53952.1 hypothetical protein MKOR_12030 [Mycolicibacillus koreensis]